MHPSRAQLSQEIEIAMYMRIVRARSDPATLDGAAASQVGQELAAAVRRQPGCQSFMAGADRASGRTITVSTWDTEEHARYSPDALGEVVSKILALGAQPEPPEVFEVTVT
jgi:quinol monooxygenase YgiN